MVRLKSFFVQPFPRPPLRVTSRLPWMSTRCRCCSKGNHMKSTCALVLALSTVGYAAWFSRLPGNRVKSVSLKLVDRDSGDAISGVVRIRKPDGTPVVPDGLISRGWGLERNVPISEWYVVPSKASIDLPQTNLIF